MKKQKPARHKSAAKPKAHNAAATSAAASSATVQTSNQAAASTGMAERLFGGALQAHQQGKLAEAEAGYLATLRLRPHHSFANNNLAILYKRSGRSAEAETCYAAAVAAAPEDVSARVNQSTLYAETGRNDKALAILRVALSLNPAYPDGLFNIGNCLRAAGDKAAAETAYDRALKARPGMPEALSNKGELLREKVRLAEAADCYVAAIAARPDLSAPFNNLGETLKEQGRLDEAVQVFNKGLELHPNEASMHSNLLFLLNYNPGVPPDLIWKVHRHWGMRHADPLTPAGKRFANDRNPGRRLRIGYVSPDFCTHSCAYFSEPLLQAHDKGAVELFLYMTSTRSDSATRRFQALADRWTSLVGLSDADAAARIEADQIDVLVDLSGHTGDSRLLVFARKPAPVQVSWLGYPNTTGMAAMDYRFSDAVVDPPGMHDQWHSEKLARLPGGFLCFRPVVDVGAPAPAPCLPDKPVTFGSFNNTSKVTPEVVKVWAEILRRTPGSRMIVKSRQLGDGETRRRLTAHFEAAGAPAGSYDLLPRIDAVSNHLRAYDLIDVGLDPFPYNGTTTTCEALWMGVPVVTLAGVGHVARVGASILTHCGLAELVTATTEEYIAKATALAADRTQLAALRDGMRARLAASPLFNYAGFARGVENAYRAMWRDWLSRA